MPESYDDRIDWERFYRERMRPEKQRLSGKTLTGFCPLPGHDNHKTPAFSANIVNGFFKCHGCGAEGNATKFLAALDGIDTKAANRRLLELAGIDPDAKKQPRRKAAARAADAAVYDVAAYAAEKHLDAEMLGGIGLTASRGYVEIPYYDEGGAVACVRRRFAPDAEQRFSWKRGSKLCLYGLWFLPRWREVETRQILLVEGESDCHALWSLGIMALGVPGAGTFRGEWVAALDGFDVAISDEGDDGAKLFRAKVTTALADAGFAGAVGVFTMPGDVKDPAQLYIEHGDKAKDMLAEALRAAESVDMSLCGSDTADSSTPLGRFALRCPNGWMVRDDGVYGETKDGDIYCVTATPVVISRRIVDAGGAGERIELSFLRDGAWRAVVADRDAAFASRSVVSLLAPLGAHITSENARHVVRWLGALEAANLGRLDSAKSSSTLGWCGTAFLPIDPGDVVLDADESSAEIVGAFRQSGDAAAWCEMMAQHRDESPVFRFMLASSFAAPLLRAVRGRILFVYNWGNSKGGKTAAVKAALSVWGEPDILMTTFNATTVGLERLASLMRDLPLGIDERQMAGGDQRRLDQIVYTLASGTGRVRGARDGGLQTTTHWRSLVLATGEEPLSGSTSQTGVSTRVLEVFGAPFPTEAGATAMHVGCAEHFGHAGPLFIERVKRLGDAAVREAHGALLGELGSFGSSRASSHLSGVALVTLADALVSEWLFGAEAKDAMLDAKTMALSVVSKLEDAAAGDVDEAACQWLEGWLRSNHGRFSSDSYGPVYGEADGDVYRVLVPVLREAMESAGFNYKKTLRALDGRGVVERGVRAGGGVTTSTVARIHGKPSRVVTVDVSVLLGVRQGVEEVLPF